MVNAVWVNADHGRDFHPLANHMTNLRNFTKEENCDFSAILFSLQLTLEQANLIICLMISQKKLHTKFNKQASMLQWILGRFVFLHN